MVQIQMKYLGDLQMEATHGPSKTTLITDAPVDNNGKGRSFSPTDLVATALGSCMATIMAIVAERNKIDLSGMTVRVEKEMASKPARRIGSLKVQIAVPNPVSEQNRTLLENAAKTCPVHHSLHPEVKVDVQFSWK